METIRLLARADDAGMNETANRAIRATAVQGIVRNISLMAPAQAIDNAAEVLADLEGSVAFGLHVTLTAEWENIRWSSVADTKVVQSLLAPDGSFFHTTKEFVEASPDPEEAVKEASAQLDRLTSLGFRVSYLDEHMGVGSAVGVADALGTFGKEKGLILHRALVSEGELARVPNWTGPGEHPGTELADCLSSLESGTYYLVGHPVFKSAEMSALYQPGKPPGHEMISRNRQRRMFVDIEIVDYCENRGIELLKYSDV